MQFYCAASATSLCICLFVNTCINVEGGAEEAEVPGFSAELSKGASIPLSQVFYLEMSRY